MPLRFRILAGGGGAGPAVERTVAVKAGPGAGGAAAEVRIGRRADLELPLPFAAVSALHARVRWQDGAWTLEDLDSAGGTWLAGERLPPHAARPLAPGARFGVGPVALIFDGEAES